MASTLRFLNLSIGGSLLTCELTRISGDIAPPPVICNFANGQYLAVFDPGITGTYSAIYRDGSGFSRAVGFCKLANGAVSDLHPTEKDAVAVLSLTGTGDNQVVANVRDPAGNPVRSCVVIVNTGEFQLTAADGTARFLLANGDYSFRFSPPVGWQVPPDRQLEVDGDASFVQTIEQPEINQPDSAGFCVCSLLLVDVAGQPADGAEVIASLSDPNPWTNNNFLVLDHFEPVFSQNGLATIILVRNKTYQIKVRYQNSSTSFEYRVPNVATQEISAAV